MFRRCINAILDFIYPTTCAFCKEIISGQTDMVGVCNSCLGQIKRLDGDLLCKKCGRLLAEGSAQNICRQCTEIAHAFDKGFALMEYNAFAKNCIYRFKYGGRKEYAIILGTLMAECFEQTEGFACDMLIPIPLHKERMAKRGYNQAELIAAVFSRQTGIPLQTDILFRVKNTTPQSRLNLQGRRKNLADAFVVHNETKLAGKRILLVDDIFTSGSTLDESARLLKKCGATHVFVCTIAIVEKNNF